MNDRPNVLWIQTDEQRPDSLGCMGSAWARTPHLDALAARGVVFRNCVCQSPVCAPSRTSQMTCRYPQEVGVLHNDGASGANPLAMDAITFPAVLEDAGYETVSFGKTHLPPMRCWSRDEQILNLDEYAGFYKLGPGYDESTYQVVTRPGLNQVILAGVYPGGDDHPSKRITDWAIDYLKQRDSDRPFLLRVSHNWPHTPVLAPPPFDTWYEPDDLPIRYFDEQVYAKRSAFDRRIADAMRMRELTREQVRQMWAHYMGLCACVDHEAGRLLTALRELDLEGNTIVIFSSDHGRTLGEWGASEKCQFDDAVWRVPMIWSFPQALPQGEVRHDVCELLDTGRTLLPLLGLEERLPEAGGWRGRNLFGDPEPDAVFGQIGWPSSNMPLLDNELVRAAHQRFLPAIEGGHPYDQGMRIAVRTRDLAMDVTWMRDGRKLVGDDLDGNLFDLRTDPATRDNRYHDPAFANVRRDLLDKLDRWQSSLEAPPAVFG